MAITAHVYQIYIAAEPDRVWAAITDSEWTRRYFHGTAFAEPPRTGSAYRTVQRDGSDAVDGVVEEMSPPADGAPGRFVVTWRFVYDAALADEPPSRVEWTVERAGEGLTRVRLVHGDLAFSPLTWAHVKDGWVWVLDAMKTLVESGQSLPRAVDGPTAEERSGTGAATEGDWHRRQGVEANNAAYDLLTRPSRSADEDEELLRRAYAAAYHWQQATGATAANQARAAYLVSRALSATGQPERALVSAEGCLEVCRENGLVDFDLAYGHEARARALAGLGEVEGARAAAAAARAVPIADEEDRAILAADLADLAG